ncbi:hypothetical protein O0L34_g16966 [Tuta absoluta]|nr:hypothetical protein O0L34_g16966 [Tuta absoluta]
MAPRSEKSSVDWQLNYSKIRLRSSHLFRTCEWADCTFQFESSAGAGVKGSLEAHKLILAMASPVFAAMFYGFVGDKESPVIIRDIDLPTFSNLLKYIYTDKVQNISNVEAAISLYKAANKYILVHLERACLEYLFKALNPNNVCQVYELACFFGKNLEQPRPPAMSETPQCCKGENLLVEKCLELFATRTRNVLKGYSFQNADISTVKKIVSMDTLDITSEIDLFNAIIDNVDKFKKPNDDYQQNSRQSTKIIMEQGNGDQQISNREDNNQEPENTALHLSETRRSLQGIIEQIRFLSMTPADVVKINERGIVLTDHEILSLLTNMLAPDSKMPIPAGFSCIKDSRCSIKDSGSINGTTFRNTVINVKRMVTGQKVLSPPYYVRNLAWRICAKRELVHPHQEFLGFYLNCDPDSLPTLTEDWSCNANLELRLLSNTKSNLFALKSSKYCKKNTEWGFPHFIEWSKLIDPMNNYVKNDSITLEVHFITEPVKSVDFILKSRRMGEERIHNMMELDHNG